MFQTVQTQLTLCITDSVLVVFFIVFLIDAGQVNDCAKDLCLITIICETLRVRLEHLFQFTFPMLNTSVKAG